MQPKTINPARPFTKISMLALGTVLLLALGIRMSGQQGQSAVIVGNVQITGLPDDWTHHHLVFSNPGTEAQATAQGRSEQWFNIVNDPRYIIQQLKRHAPVEGPLAADVASVEVNAQAVNATSAEALTAGSTLAPATKARKSKIKKDWSVSLGSGTAATLTGTVGTLSSSTISSSSTLTVDGVTFDASPPTPETGTLTMGSSQPSSGSSLAVGGITYNFSSTTLSTTQSANTCGVETGSGRSTTTGNLVGAMTSGSSGNGKGTSAWECNSDVPADTRVSVSSFSTSSHTITLQAVTLGSTGFSAPSLGSTGFTWGSVTNGTDGTTSGTASPPTFAYWSGANYVASSQVATNIATAINANTTLQTVSTGVSASASSANLTITARAAGTGGNSYVVSASSFSAFTGTGNLSGGASAAVQPNAYPAKYGVSLTGASCSDFAVYPTGVAGSSGAANIIAYDNLYATGSGAPCSGGPSAYWAYNTGGTATTSPILSEDGSQVAFIQVSGTTASLVLLKWAASTSESIGSPMTLTSQSASNYRSCTAPCMYSVALSGSPNDTLSAPFYDYAHDFIYVGDDSGNLHQFSGVFKGAPAESGSPWPVHLGSNKLSSPVYDTDTEGSFQGGYVFVGDMGGVLYGVGTGYGGTTNGQIHGNTGSLGDAIADAPLVDSAEGTVLVFVTTNGSYSYTGYNGVWEFVSSFTTLGTPGVVEVGCGASTTCGGTAGGYYLYAGDFDNVYYDSGNPAYGHLYVVGNTGVTGGATLYQVEIAYSSLTGTVNSVATGLNSTEHAWPSPLTEFCNGACAITSQRSVTGKVSTTSPEITILSGSGTFSSADVGAVVTGTDIPFGDTISSVLSSTTANLTTAPSASVSSETLAIQGGQTTSGTDYVFFSVNRGTPSGCTNAAGDGCILSYNVSNPTSVSLSGSGLNVTTPGTNGCWATGGMVIDNSAATTGASQIYFVNLDGAAAGGPAGQTSSNCTATPGAAPTISATQAAQSSP